MTRRPTFWSCSRWGHTSLPMVQNPGCKCSMCDRHRATLDAVKPGKKKSR